MSKPSPMGLLLSVVDPEYPGKIYIDEIEKDKNLLTKAVRLAVKNGLYYYFRQRLQELGVNLPFSEKEQDEENQRLLGYKQILTLLSGIPDDYGIDYIIIKACTTVPHIPRDVDILVHQGEEEKIIKVLENKGMECTYSRFAESSLEWGEYMRMDVYSRICYMSLDFMGMSFLWQSPAKNEAFGIEYPSLNKEANFLLMLVHALFGHRRMTLLDFLHMKNLRHNIDIDTCQRHAYQQGWGSAFDLTIKKLDSLHERVYHQGEIIYFPYIFDTSFTLKCISGIEGLNKSKGDKIFFYVSLVIDWGIHKLKDSPLYNLLKSFEPTRNLFNATTAFVKNRRGDKKSLRIKPE